jgi:DNA-binding beta-propeller fold protein YncE
VTRSRLGAITAACVTWICVLLGNSPAFSQLNSGGPQILSTGQIITPLAPTGARFQALNPNLADAPTYTAGQAVTTVVSPDGKTLLILTSGYNLWNYTTGANAGNANPADSNEYVFVFDISGAAPVQKQVIQVPNTYSGIAFNPSGTQFYVSGGWQDSVHIFGLASGTWTEIQSPALLGHLPTATEEALANYGGLGLETLPMASGLAVSANGQIIVVANYENDSISVLTPGASGWAKSGELDMRPGVINPAATGVPGGEFPYWVSIVGNSTAYVTSIRDREVDVVNISIPSSPALITRISLPGNPNRSVLSKDQSLLYVAQDNSDSVAVISTGNNRVLGEIKVGPPQGFFPSRQTYNGANPNSLALSPDGRELYVTDGALNAVAVVSLDGAGSGHVDGLIPTGFYPNSVSLSADGKRLYIVNGKSATGPNPLYCYGGVPIANGTTPNCAASNEYDWQLTKAGFQTVPTPSREELDLLTNLVLTNDHMDHPLSSEDAFTMAELHKRIQHVIYIIKENKTYDQVLGDLPEGNGDPSIVQFGENITPSLHAVASNFVDFDNFYDVSDVSGDGWPWSTSARTTDTIEKEIPVEYAGRGGDDNAEGENRNVNVGVPNVTIRGEEDPLEVGIDGVGNTQGGAANLLPGTGNVAAPDSSDGDENEGYIWNAANKAGLSVRDYGMIEDLDRYDLPAAFTVLNIPEDPTPFADHVQVGYSSSPFLAAYTDIYFRGFDNSFPDYYRFQEWNREFQQFDANGGLPALSLVRLMHDHTGNFSTAINGVNTPELQVADNDYAVGLLIQAVANSKNYKENTLIFVIEDDSQDGGDHIDAHRSIAFVAGPYVKQGYVDSHRYNTVSMLRTIEDILGTPHLNLNDANASPMADAFDLSQKTWTFQAVASPLLADTTLPIPPSAFAANVLQDPPKPRHDATWWAANTRGMDFSIPDHLDTAKYNRVLWTGIMGDQPYPANRSGLDMRSNRADLLRRFHEGQLAKFNSSEGGQQPAGKNDSLVDAK